jgi:ribosomal protein S18 acetylase RimI-like enzyme
MDTSRHSEGSVVIRRATPNDVEALKAFVKMVIDEVYVYLWAIPSLAGHRSAISNRIDSEDWTQAWVAFDDDVLIGTVRTSEEWLEDLWVLDKYRGRGVGRQLLLRGEAEIRERGYKTSRLRVVKANESAVAFYKRMGWHEVKEFPYQDLPPIAMLELSKT